VAWDRARVVIQWIAAAWRRRWTRQLPWRSGGGQPLGNIPPLPKGVDYYLLRFIDFSVEPGKNISTA